MMIDPKYDFTTIEKAKNSGCKYAVVEKRNDFVRFIHPELLEAVGDYFGCQMAENPVYIYDLHEDRKLEPKEFEREVDEVAKRHGL